MTMHGLRAAAVLVISSTALGLGGCSAGTDTPASTAAAADTKGATTATGPQGADGATGATGPAGPEGAAGPTGAAGPKGVDGADGAQGLPGAKGDPGGPGPTGAHGATGAPGAAGDPGLGSLVDVTNLPLDDAHCPGGGLKIDVGIDTNRDGTLQVGEIDQTTYSCQAVKRKRVVFVTSQTFDGNLGGTAGADAKCMAAAAGGAPALASKTFRAWVSTAGSAPAATFSTDGSFVTVGGAVLGDSFNNLREGTLMSAITSETDAPIVVPVWTGTTENGYNVAGDDCSGWTDASNGVTAQQASSDIIQWYWSSWNPSISCDQQAALYCFEQ